MREQAAMEKSRIAALDKKIEKLQNEVTKRRVLIFCELSAKCEKVRKIKRIRNLCVKFLTL